MFVSFLRTTKYALQNFGRNFWLSLVTIIVLTLTLFSISLISSLNLIADNAIASVKERVDLTIFFKTESSRDSVLDARNFLMDVPEVRDVTYVSKDEALENFKIEHANEPDIQQALEEIEDNPLPESLIVKAQDIEQFPAIMVALDNSDFNDLIDRRNFADNSTVIDRLTAITNRLSQVGFVVSMVFVVIAILVVFNTVRVAIYTHREELGIMRLVGATNWFIRGPFVIESVLYALLASLLAIGIFYPILITVAPYINNLFSGYDFDALTYFRQNFFAIFGLEMGIAVVLSVFSSLIAIGRYLRDWQCISFSLK